MAAVWYRFRAELRTRWRAWFGLALLVGVAGGAVLALVAGARRTDSAYQRFLRSQDAYDVLVKNIPDENTALFDPAEVERLPQVAASTVSKVAYLDLGGGQTAYASVDGGLGTEINRFKITDGRNANPSRPEEAVIPFTVAESFDLEVGDRIRLYNEPADLEASVPPDERTPEQEQYLDAVRRVFDALPGGRLEVVGIEASPGEFPPQFAGGAPVHLTPAFARVAEGDGEIMAVRLRDGQAGLSRFVQELEQRSGGQGLNLAAQAEQSRNIERSTHLQAVSLWLLAGLTALVGLLTIAQLLARQALLESDSYRALEALGMAREQRWMLGLGRAVVVGAVGAMAAGAIAVALSPLMPTGLARVAEPDPGFAFDWVALVVGGAAVLLAVVLTSAWPVWRATRRVDVESAGGSARASGIVTALSRIRIPAPASIGVRLALEPGAGRTAVPVRTSLAVVTLGISVLVATLTFSASFAHLLDTPRLYGLTWDFSASNYGSGPPLDIEGAAIARNVPGVEAFSLATAPLPVEVAGERADAFAIDAMAGEVLPPQIEGSPPSRSDEIVLGERTRRAAEVDIGERVTVRVLGGRTRRMRVVGTAVLPTASEVAGLGEGALLTFGALDRFVDERSEDGPAMLVRSEPGAEPTKVLADLQRGFEGLCEERPLACPDGPGELALQPEGKPTDIINFGRVRNMPLLLGGVLAVLAAGTLGNVLVSAIRRRRRDLAILKTLGFERGQINAAVAWQANAVIAIGLVVGVPVGVAVGRWVWSTLADQLGILPESRVPSILLVVVAIAAIALANAIAVLPARSAGRTRPAIVLRAE
jgi:ABC-type lipoprotein release transport system permease subunit